MSGARRGGVTQTTRCVHVRREADILETLLLDSSHDVKEEKSTCSQSIGADLIGSGAKLRRVRRFFTFLFFLISLSTSGAIALVASQVPAQQGAPLPGMMPTGVFLPSDLGECCQGFRVGQWVEYLVVRRLGNKRWHLHLAAVGQEEDAWWIEMTMAEARRGEAVCKMLINHGAGDRNDRLKRVIIQPEGHLPLELPVEAAVEQIPPVDAGEGPGELVGTERVKVRAGTFEARHYRRGEGPDAHHVWLSDTVALWGLTKYRSPRVSLTLLAQGTGAVSRITGTPVPFDPTTLR